MAAFLAVLTMAGSPARAEEEPPVVAFIPVQAFGLAAPNFCAEGTGIAQATNQDATITAVTYSEKSDSSGACNTDSPAPAGTFSAIAVLEKRSNQSASGWVTCHPAPRGLNTAGAASVQSQWTVPFCGAGTYRLTTQHRITYNGKDQNGTFHSENFKH